jgi:glycosyltransferase involved in cell wall biosynthesis
MNKGISITIITATYNAEKTLEECLKSVESQTDKEFEYIIIDGGSIDSTIDIIRKNSNTINCWISEKDNGIYDAWNKGITLAKGEWIGFLGADDVLLPDAIKDYNDFINSNNVNSLDLISSNILYVDKNLNPIKIIGEKWEWKSFKKRMTIAHVMALHNKRLFQKYGIYNTKYKISADYELLLRPGIDLKAAYINKTTTLMRFGGISFSFKACNEAFRVKYASKKRNILILIFEYLLLVLLLIRLKIKIKNLKNNTKGLFFHNN